MPPRDPARSSRSRWRTAFRAAAYLAAAAVALLAFGLAWLYAVTSPRLHRVYQVERRPLAIPTSPADIDRGRRLAQIYMCQECHGADLGGRLFADIPLTAYLPAPNLTRGSGGAAARYRPEDWTHAVVDGLRPDGCPLVFMPSHELGRMTDDDLGAIVAFIQQAPAIDRAWAPAAVKVLGRVMMVATTQTVLPAERIDHRAPWPAAVAPDATAAYGEHLATTAGCRSCHRRDLSGGAGPPPGGANLTREGDIKGWSESDFVRAMRTHRRPDGSELAAAMPTGYAAMTDLELSAIWQYLQSAAPIPQARR